MLWPNPRKAQVQHKQQIAGTRGKDSCVFFHSDERQSVAFALRIGYTCKKEPKVGTVHAGLECGIFADKIEGLDAISFGPQVDDIHTTAEKASILSAKRCWDLVIKTLEDLK